MKKFKIYLKSILIYYRSKKTTKNVKHFYKTNKGKEKNYQKNIWNKNKYWDYYYQRHDENVKSKNYIPYDFFIYKIQPSFNNDKYAILANDKNLYDAIYGNLGISLPKTMFRYYNGSFMDEKYLLIDNIDSKISEIKQNIIIKPSVDSLGGKGIEKFNFINGKLRNTKNNKLLNAEELINRFKGDFIVQEEIIQHDLINILYPYSVNSLRIESYRSIKTNKVKILMGIIRMGRNKSFVDNMSSGGLGVGLKIDKDNNAKLREFSYVRFSDEKYDSHPDTNIKFKDYKIPNFNKVIESIEKLSNLIPYLRIISWDFSIDKNGNPILIELNKSGGIWSTQELNGAPYFGDFSKEVRDYLTKQ